MSELTNPVAGHMKPAAVPVDAVDRERPAMAKRRRGKSAAFIAKMREKLGDEI